MDWFLYDRELRHDKLKSSELISFFKSSIIEDLVPVNLSRKMFFVLSGNLKDYHSLTHYPLNHVTRPACAWLAVFNCFLHSLWFWQVSIWSFHYLKSYLMVSNQHFVGRHDFCFLPLPSPKSVHYTVRFASHVRTNALCCTLTLNPGFSVSIVLEGNLCWHVILSWCCSTITALLFHYAPNNSYLLVWRPNILMNKPSSMWHSWYIWPRVFKEIALQVRKGKSSLNFSHAERHLVIVASSQPPPRQIQSSR